MIYDVKKFTRRMILMPSKARKIETKRKKLKRRIQNIETAFLAFIMHKKTWLPHKIFHILYQNNSNVQLNY